MKKIACIYIITNLVNGKRYIGSTVDYYERKSSHILALGRGSHHNQYLQRAWDKYGKCSFGFGIVTLLDSIADILAIEQVWLDSYLPEYNISKNSSAPMLGRKHSEDSKERIGRFSRGKPGNRRGSKASPETIIKLKIARARHITPKHTPEANSKNRIAHLGKKMSQEARKNMSIAQSKRYALSKI